MPTYDFRCQQCGRKFALFYKRYKDYDAATDRACPHCGSAEVQRSIRRVNITQPTRDLSNLSSNEMLSVLDGGNSKEIGTLFQQVADSTGEDLGAQYQDATRRLLKGERIEQVERDLAAAEPPPAPAASAADAD